jgi:hypothetical protein
LTADSTFLAELDSPQAVLPQNGTAFESAIVAGQRGSHGFRHVAPHHSHCDSGVFVAIDSLSPAKHLDAQLAQTRS